MVAISPVTFKSACVISDSMVYLSASLDNLDEEDEYSRCMLFDYDDGLETGWYYHDVEFDVVSVCYNNNPNNKRIYALSNEGHLEDYNGETGHLSFIDGAGLNEDWSFGKGYLFTIKEINLDIFACGYDAQIFRFSENKWSLMDQGFDIKNVNDLTMQDIESTYDEKDISIIDICGRDSSEFFCVGRMGESDLIAHYKDNQWKALERKTPATLYSLLLLKNGKILTAGTQGNLLQINEDNSIKRLTDLNISADFYSLAEFKDAVYIGSSIGIYKLSNNQLTKISINNLIDENLVFKVEASVSYLWAFTHKVIARFDGSEWEIIHHPDNF